MKMSLYACRLRSYSRRCSQAVSQTDEQAGGAPAANPQPRPAASAAEAKLTAVPGKESPCRR